MRYLHFDISIFGRHHGGLCLNFASGTRGKGFVLLEAIKERVVAARLALRELLNDAPNLRPVLVARACRLQDRRELRPY